MEKLDKYEYIYKRIYRECKKLIEEEDEIDNDFALKNVLYMIEKFIAEIGLEIERDSYPLLELKVATTLYSFELVKKFIAGYKDI